MASLLATPSLAALAPSAPTAGRTRCARPSGAPKRPTSGPTTTLAGSARLGADFLLGKLCRRAEEGRRAAWPAKRRPAGLLGGQISADTSAEPSRVDSIRGRTEAQSRAGRKSRERKQTHGWPSRAPLSHRALLALAAQLAAAELIGLGCLCFARRAKRKEASFTSISSLSAAAAASSGRPADRRSICTRRLLGARK